MLLPAAANGESSSEEESSDEEEEVKPAAQKRKAEPAAANKKKKAKKDSSDDESSEYESSGDEAPAAPKTPAARTPSSGEGETLSIFCGRLSWDTDQDSLAKFFADNGIEVNNPRIIYDRETGKSKGFGYVDCTDKAVLKKALGFDGSELDGRTIRLDESTPRTGGNTPRGRGTPRGGRGTPRGGAGGRGARTPNPPSANMFVKGLSWDTTNDSLQSAFGDSTSARVITDRDTGSSKGYVNVSNFY